MKKTKKVDNNNGGSEKIILYIVIAFLLFALVGYIFYSNTLSKDNETDKKSNKDDSDKDSSSKNQPLNNNLSDKNSIDPATDTSSTDRKTTDGLDSKKNQDEKKKDNEDDTGSTDFFPGSTTTTSSVPKSILKSEEKMKPGESLISLNGQYQFAFQSDGKLVLRKETTDIWVCNQTASKGYLVLQKDNNLVLYDETNNVKWSSKTYGHGIQGEPYLQVQDDGEVVLYDKNKNILWSTLKEIMTLNSKGTKLTTNIKLQRGDYIMSENGWHQLKLENDGKLVLKKFGKEIVWTATPNLKDTDFKSGYFVAQTDRNLVVYDSTVSAYPVWSSHSNVTDKTTNPFIRVTDDCIMAAYHSTNIHYWSHVNGVIPSPTT